MNHYQHYPHLPEGRPLLSKVPAHMRYAGLFNLLLGLALLASVTALGYTATLLGQFMETSGHLVEKVDKLEKADSQLVSNFCPFPFNPANPGCQAVAAASVPAPEAEADVQTLANGQPWIEDTGQTPLGWIYAGKNKLQQVVQAEGDILAGNIYTMLQNLNVRRLPASSKVSENRQVLSTVFAGEKVRVLAMENSGEHLWLQVARP